MRTWLVQKKLKHPGASTHPNVLILSSGKYTKSHTIQVSKTIRAPLRFVYDWCTDYRESDPKITGSKSKRKILLKNNHRVVYVVNYRSRGKPKSAVDVVTLYPPKAWHLDFTGDEDDEVGDYALTSLGPRKTRLDMKFEEHYKISRAPTKAQDVKGTHEVWDKYVVALERDYAHKNTREKS
ncbi:MAG: hypothetical protein ACHQ03_11545 [Candidatus Bathyarchaeia archaeon]